MKPGLFRKSIPHVIAIVVFLVVAVIYCKPALDGQVLQQHDIVGWKGSVQQSLEFKEKHGHQPLWTNSLFSGMPAFQISYDSNNFIPGFVHTVMTLGLPSPIQFFFLAAICFYILMIVLRVNPYVGIMGALGFAYATYNPVIIGAGHATKMWTMAYMPALLGSIILIFEKKYWLGAALTALFSCVMIAMNHPQIAYYFFIAVGIMTIYYIIDWIKAKNWKHMAMALGFTAAAAITGVLTNAVNVMSTYEYQKETIRGGASGLTDTTSKGNAAGGLDKEYAFRYSMVIPEPLVMMVPRLYGGSFGPEIKDQEDSKGIENYIAAGQSLQQSIGQQVPPQQAQQYIQQILQEVKLIYYWGGMTKPGEVGTSGPPYSGAIICFLAIIALFVIDKKYRWWPLTVLLVTIMMSWGSYFDGFNSLLYKYLPLYNKFRAPSMILVIPQLILPMLAALGVNKYITTADKKSLLPQFKKGLMVTGGLFVLLLFFYLSASFMSQVDKETLKQLSSKNQPQVYQAVKSVSDGLVEDRKSLFMGDLWRSFAFIAVAALTLFLLIRNTIKPLMATIVLTAFAFIDLIAVDARYLNKDSYMDAQENENIFNKSQVDNTILADTSFYRVFNLGGDPFSENMTSYHYNSVGGYHPAKLRLYQDIIEKRLSAEYGEVINAIRANADSLIGMGTPTLNMLNTKYFIYKEANETKAYWKNPGAMGNCWFVSNIDYVKNADAEMSALGSINLVTTAVVHESFKPSIPFAPQPDSAASIRLVKNLNDVITYSVNTATNQFAVFSEVYYKGGWKAFIDGKEAPIVKTNYLLRGLAVPAGAKTIEFRFEPKGYHTGKAITSIFAIVLIALLALGIFMEWRSSKKQAPRTA